MEMDDLCCRHENDGIFLLADEVVQPDEDAAGYNEDAASSKHGIFGHGLCLPTLPWQPPSICASRQQIYMDVIMTVQPTL